MSRESVTQVHNLIHAQLYVNNGDKLANAQVRFTLSNLNYG